MKKLTTFKEVCEEIKDLVAEEYSTNEWVIEVSSTEAPAMWSDIHEEIANWIGEIREHMEDEYEKLSDKLLELADDYVNDAAEENMDKLAGEQE